MLIQVEKALDLLYIKYMVAAISYGGVTRVERFPFPMEAVHEDWTKERLLGQHPSAPHNPGIANTFYKAGYVESWGRGIEKILSSCEEHGIPHPEFEVLGSSVTIYFSNPAVSEKTSEKTSEKILQSVSANRYITIAELSEYIGVTPRSIE